MAQGGEAVNEFVADANWETSADWAALMEAMQAGYLKCDECGRDPLCIATTPLGLKALCSEHVSRSSHVRKVSGEGLT
jgi:hypothetical protein